jgi:hypothetical protein
MFCFYAWMANPDLLPLSKMVTCFLPGAYRQVQHQRWSSTCRCAVGCPSGWWGNNPTDSPRSLLRLESSTRALPQLRDQRAADIVGLFGRLELSSVQELFLGPVGVWSCRHRLRDAYRRPPAQDRRDEDPNLDDHGGRRVRDSRSNINAHGCPADDLPRSGIHGERHRTRSSHGEHGRRGEIAVDQVME